MSFLSVGMLNTKGQHNKSLKPNAYRRDFQPHYASKGFGKCILPCWPGIGLAQAICCSSKLFNGPGGIGDPLAPRANIEPGFSQASVGHGKDIMSSGDA